MIINPLRLSIMSSFVKYFTKNIARHNLAVKFVFTYAGKLARMMRLKNVIFFRQLFDRVSCTYSYLIACGTTKHAILIDPVYELVNRDLKLIQELGLSLSLVGNTHVHADHLTGSGAIKQNHQPIGSVRSVISSYSKAVADVNVKENDVIDVGESVHLEVLSTPGHTPGCVSFYCREAGFVLTGDALLVRGCGRTDFQHGDPALLYDSIHSKLFSLPDECQVFPAHDYNGNLVSCIREEKLYNPRLTKSREEFIVTMNNLNLPRPKLMDIVVPKNMKCGI